MNSNLLITLPFAVAVTASHATDALLDAYTAEKSKIATQFQEAVKACPKTPATASDGCKRQAQETRRKALVAASTERNTGLKCRDTCGLVLAIRAPDAPNAPTASWQVDYKLYDGTTATITFARDPILAVGDKVALQAGTLTKR